MNSEELRRVLESSPCREYADRLMAHTEPAVRMRTTRVCMDQIPIGASRMGGLPDLHPKTPWPKIRGRPIEFLSQINFAEAAAVRQLPGFPDSGWLIVFFDIRAYGDNPADWRGLFFDCDPGELRRVAPEDGDLRGLKFWEIEDSCAGSNFHPAAVTMEPWTCPLPFKAYEELGILDDDDDEIGVLFMEQLDDWIGNPYHLLGGIPTEVQGDPRGPHQQLLLQIDTDNGGPGWQWGDMGMMYFVTTNAGLDARDFSQVVPSWDCY